MCNKQLTDINMDIDIDIHIDIAININTNVDIDMDAEIGTNMDVDVDIDIGIGIDIDINIDDDKDIGERRLKGRFIFLSLFFATRNSRARRLPGSQHCGIQRLSLLHDSFAALIRWMVATTLTSQHPITLEQTTVLPPRLHTPPEG